MEDRTSIQPNFQKGSSYKNSLIPSGVTTLEKFTETTEVIENNEYLKLCGLSDHEIQIYNNHKNGIKNLENLHKNIEKSALEEILENIQDKITESDVQITCSSSQSNQSETSTLKHPINHLKDLQDDIFGHFDIDNLPSASKRQKFVRRMTRKLAKEIPLPNQTFKDEKTITEQTHTFNDFIKHTNDSRTSIARSNSTNKYNSKWDIKETIEKPYDPSSKNITVSRKRQIGCTPKTLYTIRDNKIVRLEKKEETKSEISNCSINSFNLVNLKLPINESEKKILEGTKLSVEDIKSIPKFQNYDPGTPSKILFLKNLNNNITENDLKNTFNEYGKYDIRLMNGKMKGQAFLTFETADVAANILNEKNGIILYGKPIIIQYGKRNE